MSRYGDLKQVFDLDIDDGVSLIAKAFEKQAEDKAFQLYVAKYPWMTEETYMPFAEFYKPQKEQVAIKPEFEILSEVKEILDTFKGGVGNRNF